MLAGKKPDRRWVRMPLSSGVPETVMPEPASGLTFVHCAVAGSRVCVLSESEDPGKQLTFSLFDPIHGRQRELAKVDSQFPTAEFWSLSPDGRRIVLVGFGDLIRVLDLQTGQVKVVHPQPPQTNVQIPTWAADGKTFFDNPVVDENGRLAEVSPDGPAHMLLENPNGWVGAALPSPDGKRIAFVKSASDSTAMLVEHF
jgi:dipeptidyl aminopeptidase/acylaminoacyl peptidase